MRGLVRGTVAVVTGGASGIGLALARQLTDRGMRVLLIDVHRRRLAEATKALPGSLAVEVDVGDAAAVDEAARRGLNELGPASVVCANAGIAGATGSRLWELTPADWDRVLQVNLMGVVHTIRSFFTQILAAGGGHVLATASMGGVTRASNMPAYFASKHAVVSIAETLRLQVERDDLPVGVSVLLPSRVTTNIGESHDADFGPASVLSSASRPLDADTVAGLAVEAMIANRLYVFTHPDSKRRVDAWYADVEDAFAAIG